MIGGCVGIVETIADGKHRGRRCRRNAGKPTLCGIRETTELELRRKERDAAEARKAILARPGEWSALLGRCWLGVGGAERSPAEVREMLGSVSERLALIPGGAPPSAIVFGR